MKRVSYHVSTFVMLVTNDEDHIETRQNRRLEIDVLRGRLD